jgi:hypothetical protein
MNWTFQKHRHYNAQHLQKVDKQHLTQDAKNDYPPLNKGTLTKHRSRLLLGVAYP